MVAGLRPCPQLTSLAFITGDLEGDHLAAALQQLPLLRSLALSSLPRLQSLTFLSACSLPQSLSDLSAVGSTALVPAELGHRARQADLAAESVPRLTFLGGAGRDLLLL